MIVSVQACKDRWKNIRNRYAKYKKLLSLPAGSAAKKVKEYYLAQHLHFLDKYLKSRPSKSNLEPQCRSDTHTDESELDEEESMSPFRPPSHSPSPQAQNHPSPLSSDSSKKSKMPTLKDVNQSAFDYFNRKRQNIEKQMQPLDTDLAFLQSMLSDMKAMNLVQKRRFKMGVMQLAAQILDGNEAASTSEPAYSTRISQNNIATVSSIQQPFHNVAPPSTIEQNQNVASPSISVQDENTPTFFTLSPYSTISSVSAAHVTNTSFLNEELPLNYTYNFSTPK